MAEYQVIARKFRPQTFKEVVGQEHIVTTLKNAIKFKRIAQAYLFCGPRGTGKTTLARLFAKALNCQEPGPDCEPCNQCALCREITAGFSLDVLEIDGASHRGIEDIRQINEAVGYANTAGRYKIYIIDEVHMLTKEAFNALLKTLEEPPPQVKFFFATTEPHKVLPTILSRCQRFNLNRIPLEQIVSKLSHIAEKLNIEVEQEALALIARHAEGGLRDAESLFDQIIAFTVGKIDTACIQAILGLMSREVYFAMDRAGKEGRFGYAFEIAHQVFAQGKDIQHFIEGLLEHIRTILLIKLGNLDSLLSLISPQERTLYEASAQLYTAEQCLNLIEYLVEAQTDLRLAISPKTALETILLHVMRSHFRLPIEVLVKRLGELEQAIAQSEGASTSAPVVPPHPAPAPKPVFQPPVQQRSSVPSISEDPLPTPADLGIKSTKKPATPPLAPKEVKAPLLPQITIKDSTKKPNYHYDTLLQFAARELEATISRNHLQQG